MYHGRMLHVSVVPRDGLVLVSLHSGGSSLGSATVKWGENLTGWPQTRCDSVQKPSTNTHSLYGPAVLVLSFSLALSRGARRLEPRQLK